MDIVLALGGGGIRGVAHVGVIRCLEEAGYRIAAIAGTSAGGLVGAVYASGMSTKEIEKVLKDLDQSKLFGRKPTDGPSLLGLAGLSDILTRLLGEKTFDQLIIPFVTTATDTQTGQEILLHPGSGARFSLSTAPW
jgi:NTE family protein